MGALTEEQLKEMRAKAELCAETNTLSCCTCCLDIHDLLDEIDRLKGELAHNRQEKE
jgi:hypothetical protein